MFRYVWIILAFLCINHPAQAEKVLDVQALKTDSGISIWLVEDHNVPVISLQFSIPGGMSLDTQDMAGRANLVSILLDEGAGNYNAQEFQKALAEKSISLSFNAGRDFFTGSFKTLSKNAPKAAELLNTALTSPRFEEDAIARMKQSVTATLQQNLSDPGWIAARSYNGLSHENNNYGGPGLGTLQTLPGLTREMLVDFAKNQFTQKDLQVSIAGDITAQKAIHMVNRIFKDLPRHVAYNKKETVPFTNKGRTFLYPFDNPQTHIIAGHRGIPVTDPDWAAAQLINYTLGGGGFDSRLMTEIREKRGLSYGVSTYLSGTERAPAIQASLSASNENASETIKLIKSEWTRMATTGPTAEELENAKAYLTGSLLLSLTSTDGIAAGLNGLQQYGLDADYINERNDRLNAVTLDDVRVVAGRLLNPDNLLFVMVGKPLDFKADITLDYIPGMTANQGAKE